MVLKLSTSLDLLNSRKELLNMKDGMPCQIKLLSKELIILQIELTLKSISLMVIFQKMNQ
jgi:hypothetical protein